MMYALYSPYNERWFALTCDLPQFKNDNLYMWSDEYMSAFDTVDDIIDRILHYNVNNEDLCVVEVCSKNHDYIPDFTTSFTVTFHMIDEFLERERAPRINI